MKSNGIQPKKCVHSPYCTNKNIWKLLLQLQRIGRQSDEAKRLTCVYCGQAIVPPTLYYSRLITMLYVALSAIAFLGGSATIDHLMKNGTIHYLILIIVAIFIAFVLPSCIEQLINCGILLFGTWNTNNLPNSNITDLGERRLSIIQVRIGLLAFWNLPKLVPLCVAFPWLVWLIFPSTDRRKVDWFVACFEFSLAIWIYFCQYFWWNTVLRNICYILFCIAVLLNVYTNVFVTNRK